MNGLIFAAKLHRRLSGSLFDFLEGNVYFKVHRENHNLDRARTQFKLVADMEKK